MTTRCSRPLAILAGAWLVLHLTCPGLAATRPQIDLTGKWDFYPDVGEASLERVTAKPTSIVVPGAWQAQGYGPSGGSIPSSVVGSDLTPAEYLRHNLTARCLYVREIEVPAAWRDQRVFLCVRRVYRYADVTLNGQRIGEYEGFSSPFEFDVTDAIRFGQKNEIVLGVDNRQRTGRDTVGTANYFTNTGASAGTSCLNPARRIGSRASLPSRASPTARRGFASRSSPPTQLGLLDSRLPSP